MFTNCGYLGRTYAANNLIFILIRRNINRSHYDVLKVSPTCSSKEIRDAFIVLSKQNHPDKHMNDPSMHEKFVQINEAYSTLINPSKRRAYDLTLYHKRKLRAPYDSSYTERKSSVYSDTFHSHRNSSYTSTGEKNYYKDPFSWHFHDQQNSKSKTQDDTFGSRKYSNSTIVSLLISFTILGVILQILAIRSSFITNHDKMMERSREYSLIHSMAREKAKLYGNTHQIDVLKNKLDRSFQSTNEQKALKADDDPLDSTVPVPNNGKNGGIKKCALHGNHDCKKLTDHQTYYSNGTKFDQSSSELSVVSDSSNMCKKCKRQKNVKK